MTLRGSVHGGEEGGCWARAMWISALASPLSSCVTLRKGLPLSLPQCPHLQNGHDMSTYFTGWLWGLSQKTNVKEWEQFQACSKYSINISCYHPHPSSPLSSFHRQIDQSLTEKQGPWFHHFHHNITLHLYRTFNFSKGFHIYYPIWSLQWPCAVERTSIIIHKWQMRQLQHRKVKCFA